MATEQSTVRFESSLDAWRPLARQALAERLPPAMVRFVGTITGSTVQPARQQSALFSSHDTAHLLSDEATASATTTPAKLRSSKRFERMAKLAARHSDAHRFDLLYRILWRLQAEGPVLLQRSVDPDVADLERMARQVRRDAHKAKAFVRFSKLAASEFQPPVADQVPPDVASERGGSGEQAPSESSQAWYVSWHRSDHDVLPLVADFFADRFSQQKWAILSPIRSLVWDLQTLGYGRGVERHGTVDDGDGLDGLWRSYYSSIFNPARVNPRAMLQEMPSRYWSTLPEARLIPNLLREAGVRTDAMLTRSKSSARPAPPVPDNLSAVSIASALPYCQACGLCDNGTQPVAGRGPTRAQLMVVGEAPGDLEEQLGVPFAGPSGALLDECLGEAGIERDQCFVTNAVKHFKFKWSPPTEPGRPGKEDTGSGDDPDHPKKRRIHQGPSRTEVSACRPFLQAELAVVRPKVVLCLGATAAQSIIHPRVRLSQDRGSVFSASIAAESATGVLAIPTYHPAHILRTPDSASRELRRGELIGDLKKAVELIDV